MSTRVIIIFFFLSASILLACQKKGLPVITERRNETSPGTTPAPSPVSISPDTARGKSVFMNRCGKCHGLPEPTQFSVVKWEAILERMIPRARLNEEQEIHLSAYIRAHASQTK